MRRWVACLVLCGAVLTACDASSGSAAPGAASTAPSVLATTSVAPVALQFTADVVGGGTMDFRAYAGRTLALWFWAPT